MKLESFWTDTTAPFEGRSDELPAKADVVVVGGGFTGLSAARKLAMRGARVVVLEASVVAAEASGRNGGHVNNGLAVDYTTVAARVGVERAAAWYRAYDDAVDTVERIVREEEIACDFHRRGKLKIAGRPAHYDALVRSFERLRRAAPWTPTRCYWPPAPRATARSPASLTGGAASCPSAASSS